MFVGSSRASAVSTPSFSGADPVGEAADSVVRFVGYLWSGPLTDLDYFFLPAVRIALSGHPLLVYAVRFQAVIANDNGPLGLLPLTTVAGIASWFGWDDKRLLHALVLAAF